MCQSTLLQPASPETSPPPPPRSFSVAAASPTLHFSSALVLPLNGTASSPRTRRWPQLDQRWPELAGLITGVRRLCPCPRERSSPLPLPNAAAAPGGGDAPSRTLRWLRPGQRWPEPAGPLAAPPLLPLLSSREHRSERKEMTRSPPPLASSA